MTNIFHQRLKYTYTLLACSLILFLLPAAAAAAPQFLPDRASLDDFSNVNYLASEEQLPPSRTIMQTIGGQFYKWHEYENPATGQVAIYLLEPEEKALCSAKAYELLQLSGQWKYENYAYQYQPAEGETVLNQFTLLQSRMTDDRTAVSIRDAQVYPYNTVGFLTTDFPFEFMRGTGFLVSPHTVITNAHNVYSPQFGGWYRTIRFTPAQHEDSSMDIITPYSTFSPDQAAVNSNFKNFEERGNREQAINYDYAAIFFEEPFREINTFMPLEFNHIPEQISLLGYPGNVRGKLTLGMWLSEGPLVKNDEFCLYYEAYTSGGNSGSPVFVYNEAAGTYRVVAVHSFASINYFSGGPHLNNKNRSLFEEWLLWTPELEAEQPEDAVVDEQEVMIPDLSLDRNELSLVVDDTRTLIVTVNSDEISYNELIWISNNPQIVTVDESGTVKAISEGKTIVRVTTPDGRIEAVCEVTVLETTGSRLPGDISGSNTVDVQDVAMVTRHVLNYASLSEEQQKIADVNKDGVVDVRDVTLIMQFVLGLIDTL